jgi:hypothetical protein
MIFSGQNAPGFANGWPSNDADRQLLGGLSQRHPRRLSACKMHLDIDCGIEEK